MSTQSSRSGRVQIVVEAGAKCPLCGGQTIQDSGEIICASCGAVLGQANNKNSEERPYVKPSVWNYTSFKEGESQLLSKDRTELRIALMIEKLGDELGLSISVKGEAVLLSRRILRAAREVRAKGAGSERLTVEDITISSLILACRIAKVPRSIKDVVNAGKRGGFEVKGNDVFRKVLKAVLSSGVRYRHSDPNDYTGYLVSRLVSDRQVENSISQYVNPNEYARFLHRKALTVLSTVKMMEGRSPWLMAASSICLADQVLSGGTGLIGRTEISRVAGCGLSNINETFALIKRSARLTLEPSETELKLRITAMKERLRKVTHN